MTIILIGLPRKEWDLTPTVKRWLRINHTASDVWIKVKKIASENANQEAIWKHVTVLLFLTEQVETKELNKKYQEKMAKKNAIIRELEEENKFLASEVASLAKENKSLKKKLRESQGTMKEDEECKKLTEEIQRFHKEIEVAMEMQKQKKIQEAMEKYMQKMGKKLTPYASTKKENWMTMTILLEPLINNMTVLTVTHF